MIAIFGPNRVLEAIERMRERIAAGVKADGSPITADLVEFERALDNSVVEHFEFQTLQAQAHALGKLNTNEATTIYAALGEVPGADGWAEGTDLATKIVVTEVMGELVTKKMRGHL